MHSFAHNPRRTQHGASTTQSPPRQVIQCTHDARTTARTTTRTLTTTGRIVNSNTQRPGAVRKWLLLKVPICESHSPLRYEFRAKAAFPRAHARTLARTISRKHSPSLTPHSHHHLDISHTLTHLCSHARTHASHTQNTTRRHPNPARESVSKSSVSPFNQPDAAPR
jgi:hypothetical protein